MTDDTLQRLLACSQSLALRSRSLPTVLDEMVRQLGIFAPGICGYVLLPGVSEKPFGMTAAASDRSVTAELLQLGESGPPEGLTAPMKAEWSQGFELGTHFIVHTSIGSEIRKMGYIVAGYSDLEAAENARALIKAIAEIAGDFLSPCRMKLNLSLVCANSREQHTPSAERDGYEKAVVLSQGVPDMFHHMTTGRMALIAGSTGIVGGNLAALLVEQGWTVYGLARRRSLAAGVIPLAGDLRDRSALVAALAGITPTHLFFCTWLRQPTEAENVAVNGEMIDNLFAALRARPLQHAALVTGTKHYLGPFEAYGQTVAETPFRENAPRLPGQNFYYTQEDVLFREAASHGFAWTVHRPHTIIGYAPGNAMNMGQTLAVYAALCNESGEPFIFPGSLEQWNALTDVTDARILAQQLAWAATTPAAHRQAYNISNGDLFRWRWLWPQIAAYFGVEWQGPPTGKTLPLEPRMNDAPQRWKALAAKHRLAEPDVNRLVSWWHTDGDLGRLVECVNDMTESRVRGFCGFQSTPASFFDLFDRLRAERLIP